MHVRAVRVRPLHLPRISLSVSWSVSVSHRVRFLLLSAAHNPFQLTSREGPDAMDGRGQRAGRVPWVRTVFRGLKKLPGIGRLLGTNLFLRKIT